MMPVETDTMHCVCDDVGRYCKPVTVHVMACPYCGLAYEHVNGDYERCPRCGRRFSDDARRADGEAVGPGLAGELTCRKDDRAGGWWNEYGCCGYRFFQPWDAEDVADSFCPSCGARVL